jgi:hypothetical protein
MNVITILWKIGHLSSKKEHHYNGIPNTHNRCLLLNLLKVQIKGIHLLFVKFLAMMPMNFTTPKLTDVNTSGKAGAQIPHLPLGDDSSPWGR